jgi:iron complex transport system permease protein
MTASSETISKQEIAKTERAQITARYNKSTKKKIFFIFFLFILVIIFTGIAATIGAYQISFIEVYSILFHGLFHNVETYEQYAIWDLRLPRILLAILAGAGLAVAGTMMQGILKNPLAEPYTMGIASGAAFGAALAIILGTGILGTSVLGGRYILIVDAFVFALIPAVVVLALVLYRKPTPGTLVLAGISMLYIFSALTMLIEVPANPDAVKVAQFWAIGSLERASWQDIFPISLVLACCLPLLMWKTWDVNILNSGDETAESIGVNVKRTRIFVMMVSAVLTAGVVCFVGAISFVGLVAPHICRMIIGADNRFLLPASAMFGAVLLLVADTIARTIAAPLVIPIGIVTAIIGSPVFLYLILKKKGEYW